MTLPALPWKDYVTFGVALLGAVLGVMNTWNALDQRRVRVRVRPTYAIGIPGGEISFSIEVVNLSTFAITVAEVGFALSGGKRLAVTEPHLIDGKPWPRRLGPRESVSVYFDTAEVARHRQKIGDTYARTSCGEVRYGSSPALHQLRDIIIGR